MSESNPDFNLSRRRLLGLGAAVIPAAVLLGAGTAEARPVPATHPTTEAASSVQLPAHSQVVYFC